MFVANAFCLCDQRDIVLSGFIVMARVTKHLAIFERRFTAKAIGNIMVKVKFDAERKAATLAAFCGSLERIALDLLGEFSPHAGSISDGWSGADSVSWKMTPCCAPNARMISSKSAKSAFERLDDDRPRFTKPSLLMLGTIRISRLSASKKTSLKSSGVSF
jgi:hypothetical protein